MKNFKYFVYLFLGSLVLTGCAGMKTLTIQTQEPAQVTLPKDARKLLIVNNIVSQPQDIGHLKQSLGRKTPESVSVKTDSLGIIFTEALTQFLNEEEFFDAVMMYDTPIREDKEYWSEEPISPEKMLQLKKESGVDAVVSLDKLLVATDWKDMFIQEGYPYSTLTGKISSTMRIYMPTMDGMIPTVHFNDSMKWEGFDISDGMAYAEFIVPHAEHALKDFTVYLADKMTFVLSPHWITQERWYYTLQSSPMRQGGAFAEQAKWQEAVDKWESFYNSTKNKIDKAKAASNIALGYEMLDNIETAHTWIILSQQLFNESTSTESMDRKRASLFKTEIERRLDGSNKLNMQVE